LATGNREKTDLVNFWVQVRSLTKRAPVRRADAPSALAVVSLYFSGNFRGPDVSVLTPATTDPAK